MKCQYKQADVQCDIMGGMSYKIFIYSDSLIRHNIAFQLCVEDPRYGTVVYTWHHKCNTGLLMISHLDDIRVVGAGMVVWPPVLERGMYCYICNCNLVMY